jgi:hypothetical protein
MFHTVEFVVDLHMAVGRSPGERLEMVVLRRGDRLPAQLRPHVVECFGGPVEVADLLFEDGTAVPNVPFACFSFVD